MMTGKERICAAIDAPSLAEGEAFARLVAPEVGVLKVGLELFTAGGPDVVRRILALGRPVFLDLKLHDIPNTVLGAARSAARSGAALLTVHASGGSEMVKAAVRGAGPNVRVLAVTVLTSLDERALAAVGLLGSPQAAAVRLAKLAIEAGAAGVVCSPLEVGAVRAAVGAGPLLVVPGVRPIGSDQADQARVATPAQAIAAGADMVVIGRPLSQASDPAAAARAVAETLA